MYRNSKFANYYKRPFYKRRSFYIIIILIFVVVGFFSWSIKKASNKPQAAPQITDQKQAPDLNAKIIFLSGKIQLKTATTDWAEVAEGENIAASDNLKTLAGSRAIVELPDKSYVRLFENSEIKFTQLGLTDIVIEQIAGTSYHRVNDQSMAIFRVKSGNTELTALGTAFSVTKENAQLKVSVIESRLKAKIYDGGEIINMRTLEAGTKATIDEKSPVAQMIISENLQASTLLENEWYSWNLEKDKEKNFLLGIFEKATKLTIIEPTKTEFETDKDKLTIKGSTEKDASILVAGKEVESKDGNFETVVPLVAGENKIEIIVKKDANINKRILTVKSGQQAKKIVLTGERQGQTSIKLSWVTTNISDIKEFKLVRSKDENPVYPIATSQTATNTSMTAIWDDLADGKYNFRVCALDETNTCMAYSNNLSMLIGDAALWEQVEINLSAEKFDENNARLSWTTSKPLNSSVSLKLILNTTKTAVYPGKQAHSLDATATSDEWLNLANGTHHFRVCLFQNNQCLKFSNNVAITVASPTNPLSLTGSSVSGTINLNWTSANTDANNGFYVVLSETPNVVFPGKEYRTLTATTYSWIDLTFDRTYYFRACQNVNGSCGEYSNEISLTVK
jgi:hypothetical protein